MGINFDEIIDDKTKQLKDSLFTIKKLSTK